MKINPLNDAAQAAAMGATRGERNAQAPAGSAATGPAAPAASGVPVTVSAAARSLDVAAGSGIDEAKVAAVKAAIANGTFKVNSDAIADKLLANAQEVIGRHRS